MHPASRAACRTLAQAGIGFTVSATPPWEEPEDAEGCARAAEQRGHEAQKYAHQLDLGLGRGAYSYKPPGQRLERSREYAREYA